ncbi:hypothetical protein GHK92_18945 [Nocardioides sp. dk4132]|uniref:hypothetical protein n=1 Tax=unclassified Nocardioides TaxID=2615069 RepID=UPI0012949227|nr:MULTISPECIES: hypothetical protein [unclassified Nocardioides]MQW77949.1 hypothetical protein [Nocardioides sp. dk4132]QGA09128.1 hypothetical protein GFH29_18300 [Nocardioides sp. dk884]
MKISRNAMAVSVMIAALYAATLAPAAAADGAGEPEVPPDGVIVECFPQRLSIGVRAAQKQGTRATVRVRVQSKGKGAVGTLTLRIKGPGGKHVKRAVVTMDGSGATQTFRTKRLHKRGVYRITARFADVDTGLTSTSRGALRVR